MTDTMDPDVMVGLPPDPDVVESVPVAGLEVTPSFRESGVSEEHVSNLVALVGHWPPILVGRRDRRVIDGVHRVAAARLLGIRHIDAVFFDGDSDEALIEFVRRNAYHGLPLTLRERKRAAARILEAQPAWSDRRIAELCAISPKTVAALRPTASERPTEGTPNLELRTRIGRDNRCRPVDSGSARSRIVAELTARPDASLRAIASVVGVSPETVRAVRMNLHTPPEVRIEPLPDRRPEPAPWKNDAALRSLDDGENLLAWLERTTVTEDDGRRLPYAVPLSRIYEIADEARRRAAVWTQFAGALEARSRATS